MMDVVGLILPASWLIYIILPLWMLVRGWPVWAGFTMIVAAILPWAVWFMTLKPSEMGAPGNGIILMLTLMMLLVAMVPIAVGAALFVRRRTSSWSGRQQFRR